jgi:hypothetical protein
MKSDKTASAILIDVLLEVSDWCERKTHDNPEDPKNADAVIRIRSLIDSALNNEACTIDLLGPYDFNDGATLCAVRECAKDIGFSAFPADMREFASLVGKHIGMFRGYFYPLDNFTDDKIREIESTIKEARANIGVIQRAGLLYRHDARDLANILGEVHDCLIDEIERREEAAA